MDTLTPRPESKHNRPNPQALNAVLDRYFWWLAKQEMQKRAKRLKRRNRASSIKI